MPQLAPLDEVMPEALRDGGAMGEDDQLRRLSNLSQAIVGYRTEAVDGRQASGIENEWQKDEDAYEGIDAVNQPESGMAGMRKSMSLNGPMTARTTGKRSGSTVFIRITTQYVDSAAARVADMLLPTDDRCWDIKPEEVPVVMPDDVQDLVPAGPDQPYAPAEQQPQPAMPGMPPQAAQPAQPLTPAQQQADVQSKADVSAQLAERQIDAWLDECDYHAQRRKAIHDRAKLGVSVMKGPFPVNRKAKKVERVKDPETSEMVAKIVIMAEIKPASKRIDPWNLYPDPACGDNIHNGNYLFEKDFLTEKQLRELIGVPGYLDAEIKEVIREGPNKTYTDSSHSKRNSENALYPVWYFYGNLKRSDMQAAGADAGKSGEDDDQMPAIVTLVNDRVIKATQSILDSGEFPYDVTPWQTRSDHWAGIGVASQMREAQGGVNAAVRNMMDNAALSGGPMLIVNRALIRPVDGNWTLSPRKVFETTDDADAMADVRNAIVAVNIPNMQKEMMGYIDFFLKMAEQTTGLPMLLQGQSGEAPDTLGGQILMNNNASTVLRRLARLDDDCSTEPHISRYYEYLLIHGEDEAAKDNLVVHARGSSALVERDIQNHAILGLLQASVNPAFGVNPYLAMTEALKAQRLDPKRFQFTEAEFAKMKQQPPPPAPQVQAAQIREQGANARLQMELQAEHGQGPDAPDTTPLQVANIRHRAEVDKETMKAQGNAAEMEFKKQQAALDRAHKLQMMQMNYQMKLMEFSQSRQQSLEDTKAELAQTAAKLNLQRDLSVQATAADLHKHHNPQVVTPPTEPAGRAKPGEAFQA